MSFYDDMAAVVVDLLDEFGMSVTLTRTTGKTPKKTSTGTAASGSTTTYTPKGIVKNFPSQLIDGSRIRIGDKVVILDNTVQPQMDDEITFHGYTWNIVDITDYKPANTAIAYSVHVRK